MSRQRWGTRGSGESWLRSSPCVEGAGVSCSPWMSRHWSGRCGGRSRRAAGLDSVSAVCAIRALKRHLALLSRAPPGVDYDTAGLTAQVPLSDGNAEGGGILCYALPTGEMLMPSRKVGVPVAHHGDVAHAVTRLTRGVRYGLYALVARTDTT